MQVQCDREGARLRFASNKAHKVQAQWQIVSLLCRSFVQLLPDFVAEIDDTVGAAVRICHGGPQSRG
jgi:hypothetical protein